MKYLRHILVVAVFVLGATSAWASCWEDQTLTRQAWQVAQQRFPLVTQRMPTVLSCSADEFPPNVGGDYNSGAHRIRVPNWTPPNQVMTVLAHELAHAEVALTGAEGGADGHGAGWVAVMERAGLFYEAQRVAGYSWVAAEALAQRGGHSGSSAPSFPPAWGGGQPGHRGYGGPVMPPCGCGSAMPVQPPAPRPMHRVCHQVVVPVLGPQGLQMQARLVCTPA